MTAIMENLKNEARLLSAEEREELAYAILGEIPYSNELIAEQMKIVAQRMENVQLGKSKLIPIEEAFLRMDEAAI
jgi:2-phospho-L-lactate guanylyltransferase (CobY/MobA/RfbA family)